MSSILFALSGSAAAFGSYAELTAHLQKTQTDFATVSDLNKFLDKELSIARSKEVVLSDAENDDAYKHLLMNYVKELQGSEYVEDKNVDTRVIAMREAEMQKIIKLGDTIDSVTHQCNRCNENAADGLKGLCGIFKTLENPQNFPSGECPDVNNGFAVPECSENTPKGQVCNSGTLYARTNCELTPEDGRFCALKNQGPEGGVEEQFVMRKISCQTFNFKCPRGEYLVTDPGAVCQWRWTAISKYSSCGCKKVYWVRKLLCPCVCQECPETAAPTPAPTSVTTVAPTTTTEAGFWCEVPCCDVEFESIYRGPTDPVNSCIVFRNSRPAEHKNPTACDKIVPTKESCTCPKVGPGLEGDGEKQCGCNRQCCSVKHNNGIPHH